MKRKAILLVSLLLTLSLLASAAVAEMPEYLNLEGYAPIVNGDAVHLTIAVPQSDIQGEAKDIWFWEYARQVMKIDFEVIQTASVDEYKQLVFASGDLPDILFSLGINSANQMTYGVGEGMLLALDPYITPELMPNLSARMAEMPQVLDVLTAPDGHIYTLGKIGEENNEGSCPRIFVNTNWLEQVNMEMPTTLEEFLEMLRAFKGLGEDIVPMAGGYGALNPSLAILTAYGYNTSDPKGLTISMRNGKPVFPFGDREAYGAYLTTMHQLYEEELIARDFYTTDRATARSLMAENRTGVFAEPAYLSVPESFSEWWAMIPLTSEYNETPIWYADQSYINNGVFAVSAECKYPEVAMRFADFWFDPINCFLACYGPNEAETDLFLGVEDIEGWYLAEDEKNMGYHAVDNDTTGVYSSAYNYRAAKIGALSSVGFGAAQLAARAGMYGARAYLGMEYSTDISFDLADPDAHYRASVKENIIPYTVTGYPAVVYFDEAANARITDLKAVLNTHAESESAKFITGARDLSELDAYFNELDDLGYQEYLKFYTDYFYAE